MFVTAPTPGRAGEERCGSCPDHLALSFIDSSPVELVLRRNEWPRFHLYAGRPLRTYEVAEQSRPQVQARLVIWEGADNARSPPDGAHDALQGIVGEQLNLVTTPKAILRQRLAHVSFR